MADEFEAKTSIGLGIKRTFHRTVIRACKSCGAPGRYSSLAHFKEDYPGCFVEPGDPRDGKNILEGNCPNCGHPRPQPEELPIMEFTE